MFNNQFFHDFARFLGIDDLSPDFSKVVNKTTTSKPLLSDALISEFKEFYRDTYSFVSRTFPCAFDSLWGTSKNRDRP
jgi:hypothetical protein